MNGKNLAAMICGGIGLALSILGFLLVVAYVIFYVIIIGAGAAMGAFGLLM